MATPREILRRAETGKTAAPRPQPMPAPVRMQTVQSAPVQPAPMAALTPAVPAAPTRERIVVPQPIRSNSVYHQLMASHDRMNTRHLKG